MQETTSMATLNMSLKLLVDKKGQRVLFAEATKEFVDFLFHIFSLPLGTVIEFLGSKQMVGCLGKLKESVESFNETYLQFGINKANIFNPKTASKENVFLLLYVATAKDHSDTPKRLYRCSDQPSSRCRNYVTEYLGATCPSCDSQMYLDLTYVVPKEEGAKMKELAGKERKKKGGYVKKVATYMVMDNLVVKPMSTISSVTFINILGVKGLSQLEEKTVYFGKDDALKLLKASLTADKVLTTVFMDNNEP